MNVDAPRVPRLAFTVGLAVVVAGACVACGDRNNDQPTETRNPSTPGSAVPRTPDPAAPRQAPGQVEKDMTPRGPNSFSPTVLAPTPFTPSPCLPFC